jgi:hypothetical protein
MGDTAAAGKAAHDSEWLDHGVRFGLVAYGLVHLLVAWLALQLALGDSSGQASTSGALHEVAQQPFGAVLIWVVAAGLFLLVLWRLLEVFAGHRDERGKDRWKARAVAATMAVVYTVLGISAVKVALGEGSRSGTDSATAKLMDLPAGQLVVGAVGLAVVSSGLGLVVRAYTEKFRENLSAEGRTGSVGTAYVWFGKVGYTAKGLALGLVGGLFLYAALTHEAEKSGGLDVALQKVKDQPFGPYLLGLMALGIGCYGLFCFVRARHLSR